MSRNILHYMDLTGKTRREVSAGTGIPYSTLSEWINCSKYPRIDNIQRLAEFFGIDKSDLIEDTGTPSPLPDNIMPVPKMKKIPLLGAIACGQPILAVENIEDEVDIPEHIHADFALRCEGDSMIGADIRDGDIVYIRQQEEVQDGQIAAVLIEDEATLKRFYLDREAAIVTLVAENPSIKPMVYHGEALEEIHVLGLAVGLTRAI